MEDKTIVNIALIGDVSVGKSTILNTILINPYSECKSKRCTMIPRSYLESDNNNMSSENIKEFNKIIDEDFKNVVLTKETCVETEHSIPIITNLNVDRTKYKIKLYDIMGLNDRDNKKIYYEWTQNNFHKFDIIVLILTSLCKNEEKELLKFVLNQIKECKEIYNQSKILHCVINKCDYIIVENNVLKFHNDEEKDHYDEIKKIYEKEISPYKKYGILYPCTPLCAKDAFIYQYILSTKKIDIDKQYIIRIGENEFGKTKWYRFSPEEQIQKLNELLINNDDVYKLALLNTGFVLFLNNITESINAHGKDIIPNSYNYNIKTNINLNNPIKYFEQLDKMESERIKIGSKDTLLETSFDNIRRFLPTATFEDFYYDWKVFYYQIIKMKNKDFLLKCMFERLFDFIKSYEENDIILFEPKLIMEMYGLFIKYDNILFESFRVYMRNIILQKMKDNCNSKYIYNLFKTNSIEFIFGDEYYKNNLHQLFEYFLKAVIKVFNKIKDKSTDYKLIYHLEQGLNHRKYSDLTIKYMEYLHIIKLIVENKVFQFGKNIEYNDEKYDVPLILMDVFTKLDF